MSNTYDREARAAVESGISSLILLFPLYGTVFLYLNKIERTDLPTMAVGTIRRVDLALYYNPDFVKKLTTKELRAVLKHEALHILLHHIARNQYFGYNPKGYNYAADMAINCHIEGLPPNALYPKNFGLPDNESSEWYYGKLKEEADKSGGEMGGEGHGELVDSHDMWGDCDDEIIKEKIKSISDSALKAQEQRGYGEISGNLVQQIMAANKAAVNWQKELKWFINKTIMMNRKSTRMRPNRRYGFQNPGSKRDFIARILVAIDTSGSVSDKELQYFLQEMNGMIGHVQVDMVQWDYSIQTKPIPWDRKLKTMRVAGRGGTDPNPALHMAEDLGYDSIIMFTDAGFGTPYKPKCRVLWCGIKANEKCFDHITFGKKVFIEEKKR